MVLAELIRKVLLENVNPILQQLKDKYVGEDKLFSEDEFKKLEEVTSNKWYLIAWLTKRVANNLIKKEDVYKWKDYFQIFEKNKKKFKFQDLNQYKTPEDIQYLIETIVDIREGDTQYEDIPQFSSFLSKNEIEKLTSSGGNKYLGFYKPKEGLKQAGADGYQVFQITEPTQKNWKVYRDLLGRCKGRERGAKIEICTIAHFSYFKDYLRSDKGSSYIVLFNLNDPLSPYQLHVESSQFMNKNDVERYNFNKENFFKWLSEKSEYYNLEKIASNFSGEIPVEGKGYENEKGKQGIWKDYGLGDGRFQLITYVDNKVDGPSISFHHNGKISEKGTLKKDDWVGPYEEYANDGDLLSKGVYGNKSNPIGVWKYYRPTEFGSKYVLIDLDDTNSPVSGLTKSGGLRFISDKSNNNRKPVGKIIFFNPSGSVKGMGTLTPRVKKTGLWTVYKPDGTIKLEGQFRNDSPVGKWIFFFTHSNKEYLFQLNFDEPFKDGKLYDKNGEFIKKINYRSAMIPSIEKFFNF